MKTWQKILAAAFFIVLVLAWPVFASEAPDAAQDWASDAATSTDTTPSPTPTAKPATATDTTPTPPSTPTPPTEPTPETVTYRAVTGEAEELTATGVTLNFTYSAPASADGYTVGILYGVASDDLSEDFQTGSGFDMAADDGVARLHDLTPSTLYYYAAYVKENASGLYYTGEVSSFTTAAAAQMRALTAGVSQTLTGESVLRFAAPYAGSYRISLTGAGSVDLRSADDVRNYSAYTPMGEEFCSLEAVMTAGEEFYLDINVFDYSSTGHGVLLAVLLPQPPTVTGAVDGGKPALSWSAVTGASSYYVYRRAAGTGDYVFRAETAALRWTDSSASSMTAYDYAVRAVSAGGGLSEPGEALCLTALPKSGWVQTADGWYYYADYAPKTGWLQSGDDWYYLGADGLMYDAEWFTDANGRTYYLKSGGKMAAGWTKIENVWYYFSAGGIMRTGWLQSGDVWYYLDKTTGRMYASEWLDGVYYFRSSGVMATGWAQSGADWYYFSAGGVKKTGWLQSGDYWYYLGTDGKMYDAEGYTDANGRTYYLKSGGKMATGWTQIGEDWYYFSTSGIMKTSSWLKSGSYWYYFGADGVMLCEEWLDGTYYFKSTGKMATGWCQIDNAWYYFNSSGVMKTSSWLKSGSYWYYFKTDGKMAASENVTVKGVTYAFDSSGHWV